tara:strand:- start:81 stop:182 length:102 start_codon:yes stop_codon:yes gene_type:complete
MASRDATALFEEEYCKREGKVQGKPHSSIVIEI